VLLPLAALDRVSGLAWLAGRISHRDSGVVVPVMVVHPSDRDSAEVASTVEQADHIIAQAGLDSEVTVRLDQDEITGLRFAAAAESASLILAEWRPGSPEALRPLVEGSSENSSPLALVALDDHPVERVVVWVTRRDHAGRRPDGPTSLAIDIAGRLGERIPVVIAAPTERIAGHLATELDDATVVTASSMSAWLGTEAKPGDLVIVSLRTPWERGLRDATALAAERGVSVMLTAVPVEPGAQLAHGMRATAGV
jgi:hypothetical protein